ncbi:UPF0496 protein At2g18630 [Rutidosis leptorrhynchoides]|uniref:UPF0496 protein At2g18630 n=1 Tax=Rutidosis leptorrhynchoides TaxID=125765 RepID=UPI003A98DF0E
MMGGKSSKKKGTDKSPPLPPPQADPTSPLQSSPPLQSNFQLKEDLSLYESACKKDETLHSFDISLHERTSRVLDTLASGVEVRSLSFESLREVTQCLLEMNQQVVKVILENHKDIWNNDDLFDLVEEYLENSINTLEFCTSLENCLKRAKNNQKIVQWAVKRFEEESTEAGGGMKYVKTVEELKRFKEAGDPFSEEFFNLFQVVYTQQLSMLQKLQQRKRKFDRKLKSLKTWRRVSNVLFVTAFVAVLIFSVVAAAIAAPPVITALAGALAVPIGSVGKWCQQLWKRTETELKGQRDLVLNMWTGTYITIKDMDTIRVLVGKLENDMQSLLRNADFALTVGDEEAVMLGMDEIKKNLDGFVESIDVLMKRADKCSRDITYARTVILQRIMKKPENSSSIC